MSSLESHENLTPFLVNTAILLLSSLKLFGEYKPAEKKGHADRFDKNPLFFYFHSGLCDPDKANACTIFSLKERSKSQSSISSDSILMLPLSWLAAVLTRLMLNSILLPFLKCCCIPWFCFYKWIRSSQEDGNTRFERIIDKERLKYTKWTNHAAHPSIEQKLGSFRSTQQNNNSQLGNDRMNLLENLSNNVFKTPDKTGQKKIDTHSEQLIGGAEMIQGATISNNTSMELIEKDQPQLNIDDETQTICENETLKEMEDDFQRRLNEQNRRHEVELESRRRLRQKRRIEADEDVNQMKIELQMRINALLTCIQLKIRFSEKEQEWSEILKGLRESLIKVVNSYYDLENEFRQCILNESDESNITFEGKIFANFVSNAQCYLAQSFEMLKNLSHTHEDRIFLRIIMKCLSEESQKCNSIGYKLIDLMGSPSDRGFQTELNGLVSQIDSNAIPTTKRLSDESMIARSKDYVDIIEAPDPQWFEQLK